MPVAAFAVRVAALATFMSVVYVAIVAGAGALLGSDDLTLSIVATAVVALLFQPARERAQRLADRLVYGARATPYEVIAGFSRRVADAVSVDEVLPQMADVAGRGVGATAAGVRVLLPRGEREQRWPAGAERGDEAVSYPVAWHGEPVGEIWVTKPMNDPLTHAEQTLLRDLAGQAGLALHNVRLNEELAIRLTELDEQAAALRVSRERLITARDAQRRGLQRDIEEGPERELRRIRQRLGALDASNGATAAEQLDVLGEQSNATLEGLRDLARGIFPPLLADRGIVAALDAHIRKVGAVASIDAAAGVQERRFDPSTEACVYFCCLQAIQNVIRHASGARCWVRLGVADGALAFAVRDDGPGFDVATTPRGMGIDIMQDRVDALEGTLTVTSAPGSGTTISGTVPVKGGTH